MIHKIKALYDDGNGISIRQIAIQLDISRTTVQKYLRMNEEEIEGCLQNTERSKVLDEYREFIIHLLQKYPKLGAGKIKRKVTQKAPDIKLSNRSFRRYVSELKNTIPTKQERYYEPVLDMVPGVQCQVDLGELRRVMIHGQEKTIYFAVFVLSYSRYMFVCLSDRPVDTATFIQMHAQAFTYFDGIPEECVYDQTKLVVIREEFREVWFNDQFYRFATTTGFDLRVCKGYDPQSKGKVESGVKYVKNNFFYGETFDSLTEVKEQLRNWVDTIANERTHGTTKQIPRHLYDIKEKEHMKAWCPQTPMLDDQTHQTRKVDKVSLISHKSVKYSVPQKYQSSIVKIQEKQQQLIIYDFETGKPIANHSLCRKKGEIIRNRHHYRNTSIRISELEQKVKTLLGDNSAQAICEIIKATSPKIYRDQLNGLLTVLSPYKHEAQFQTVVDSLLNRPRLTVTFIRDYVTAQFLTLKQQKNECVPQSKPIHTLDAYKVLRTHENRESIQ